jgi:Na+-translocating ferredoxin:NAD+ oxidoreductase RnfD subunit
MRRYLIAALISSVAGIAAAAVLVSPRVLTVAAVCALTALVVEVLFAQVRRKPANGGALVYGLVLALLLPANVHLEMAAFGAAMAALFGKEVFGGTGSHIFAPALVGKGAMIFSYPAIIKGPGFSSVIDIPDPRLWLALTLVALLAVGLMAWARPGNLRILAAALLAATCLAIPMQTFGKLPFEGIIEMFLANSMLLSICLVACDPAISPRNDEAKWLYGLMIGALTVLMACFSTYSEAAMSAILVANLFVPTIDLLAAPKGKEVAA